jgi:hypothetical protein
MLARTSLPRVCRQCQRFATATIIAATTTTTSSSRALVRLPPTQWRRPVTTDAFADSFSQDNTTPAKDSGGPTAWIGEDGLPTDVEELIKEGEHLTDVSEATAAALEAEHEATQADEVPWYLEIEEPLTSPPARPDPLPEVPDDAPEILPKLLEYIYHEMGLNYLSLLDLRALETSTALGHNLIMVLGTARSERHLQVAGLRLTRWLRREHHIPATAAGLISPAEVKVKLRRLRKRAQMVGGSAGAAFEGRAHGLSTGWVVVNLGTLGENKGEQAKLDEFGRMSGFGRVVEGCTVVVQCMTEKKREQLDLEGLWRGNLEKHQRLLERLGEGPEVASAESDVSAGDGTPLGQGSGPHSRHTSSRGGGASRAFVQSSRPYTTSAPANTDATTNTPTGDAAIPIPATISNGTPSTPGLSTDSPNLAAAALAARVQHVLTTPTPVSRRDFLTLFRFVLTNPHAPLSANMAVAEFLLQAMAERGLQILDNDMLVPLIAAVAQMARGPDEARARAIDRMQDNFELLLEEGGLPCPLEGQINTLLQAYAAQQNWARFWAAFAMPARFGKSRSGELYRRMLHAATRSGDPSVCVQAVRTAVPGLDVEDPPVAMDEPLCLELLRCIAVADPPGFFLVEQVWRELGFKVESPAMPTRGTARGEMRATLQGMYERWTGKH